MFRMIFFMGKRGPKPAADRLLLITTAYPIYDDFWGLAKGGRRGVVVEKSGKVTTVRGAHLPAEPDTLIALLEAQTVETSASHLPKVGVDGQTTKFLPRTFPVWAGSAISRCQRRSSLPMLRAQ